MSVGETASFSVAATGTAPLGYQWRRDGSNIAGATANNYATPATTVADDGAQFTVVVSNAAGTVTSSGATLSVSATAGGQWGTPTLVQPNLSIPAAGSGTYLADVAVDASGNALAVWCQSEPVASGTTFTYDLVVHASRYTRSGGWTAPVRLDEGTKDFEFIVPRVVLDPAGNGIAVWAQNKQDGSTGHYVAAALFDSALGWQTPTYLNLDGIVGRQVWPAPAMTPDGQIFIAYLKGSDTQHQGIYALHYTPGGGWDSPAFLKNLPSLDSTNPPAVLFYSAVPFIAAGTGGQAVVTWRDPDGSLYAARFAAGSGWQAPEKLGQVYNFVPPPGVQGIRSFDFAPSPVAIDADGNALVLWYTDDGYQLEKPNEKHRSVKAARYSVSSGWEPAVALDAPPSTASNFFPQLGMDSSGNALASWITAEGQAYKVWSARYLKGSGWQAPTLIGPINSGSGIRMGVSAGGTGTLVYGQPNGQSLNHLFARTFLPASGWGAETLIDLDDEGLTGTSASIYWSGYNLAVGPLGDVAAVWAHDSPPSYMHAATTIWANVKH